MAFMDGAVSRTWRDDHYLIKWSAFGNSKRKKRKFPKLQKKNESTIKKLKKVIGKKLR